MSTAGELGPLERCGCGWELPLSVMPLRNRTPAEMFAADADDGTIPDAHVGLVCPRCFRGHAFYSDPATLPAARGRPPVGA